jgi:hypothetical protein
LVDANGQPRSPGKQDLASVKFRYVLLLSF